MKKITLLIATIFIALLVKASITQVDAATSMSISPKNQGSTNIELTITVKEFCIDNSGFPVSVMWDGAPIYTGIAPSFDTKYTVPEDSIEGEHTILAIANCPGQPPEIPASVDQVSVTYTVIEDSTDSEASESADQSDEQETQLEDEQATTIIDNSGSEDKDNTNNKKFWYSNWIYLSLLGLGLILLIIAIILIVHSKKRSQISSDKSIPIDQMKQKRVEPIVKNKSNIRKVISKKNNKENLKKTTESRVEFEE